MKTKDHTLSGCFSLAGLSACLSGALLLSFAAPIGAVEKQVIKGYGYIHEATGRLAPTAPMATTERLHLAIGLPLRNSEGLKQAVQAMHDPANPRYQQWMKPNELAAKFCATEEDYNAVVAWAQSKGLTVTATHGNRICIDVEGSVADIQNAFNVTLRSYQHPTEARTFFAPDTDPSIDCAVPVLTVDGLDNYDLPKPNSRLKPGTQSDGPNPPGGEITPNDGGPTPNAGSGPGGSYAGCDFRAAYFPGSTARGYGQNVGLLQYDDYFNVDVSNYETQFGLQPLVPIRVVVNGPMPAPGGGNSEVCLDIDMVLAMAPGVANIYVYEAPNSLANWVPLLTRIQTDNLCPQVSCSWSGGADNASAENVILLMAGQGQSFFNATGDQDAFLGFIPFPSMSPYTTECGGTTLTTAGACGAYTSEVVWNWGGGVGSSGGWTNVWSMPFWQQGISMAANLGSTVYRNVPDVALTGDNCYVRYNNGGSGTFGGTSCAAPLWAGVMALANEKAAAHFRAGQGLLNPALYAAGKNSPLNAAYYHDTTVGNNQKPGSGALYPATPGYDLCTGWGTPNGEGMLNYLAGTAGNVPNGGFEIGDLSQWQQGGGSGFGVTTGGYAHSGTYGAYFGTVGSLGYIYQELTTVPGQNYVLSFWLRNNGGPTNEFFVYCMGTQLDIVNSAAFGWTQYQFVIPALYTTTFIEFAGRQDPSFWGLDDITFTPLPGSPEVNPRLPVNGGFETGSFANWAVGGGAYLPTTSSEPDFIHGGGYAAGFGPVGVTNIMTQTIPTVPGQTYRLQFWLMNRSAGANEFSVWWNGTKLDEWANAGAFSYVENNYTVTATAPSTVLQFTYRHDPTYYYLDDITITPLLDTSLGQAAYVRSTVGEPWGVNNNRNAMDRVFGASAWNDERFETVDPNVLFSPSVHFIFMEGSDSGATAFNNFLTANLALMQNWVSNGGSLYLNAAPNVGGNINLGFGVTLNYPWFTAAAAAANTDNPIFNGPFLPVGTSWTGNSFAHARLTGAGLVPIIVSNGVPSTVVLAEMNAGQGHVIFGGLTTDNWHSPSPQAQNLTANILEYGNLNPMGMFDDLGDGSTVPNGYRGVNWNNFFALNGVTYSGNPSGYQAGVISLNNVAYNGFGSPASITSPAPFNLFSAWLTAAWNDNLTLEVEGFVNGVLTYDQIYILSPVTPTFVAFNMLGVTQVNFISSGGTPHPGYSGGGTHFAMDDLTLTLVPAQPGGVDHYTWSSIASPQCMNAAFPVTVIARDINNTTATTFNGQVHLAGFSGTRLLDGFETAWPHAPWVSVEGGGTSLSSSTHDGNLGLQDPGWYYRTDVSIGSGNVLSWWVRPEMTGGGRAYFGFGASAAGAFSAVVAVNTSQFLIQQNTAYGFADVATAAQTYLPGKWYKVEVRFNSNTSVTANLYDSDGNTLLNSLTYTTVTGVPGGVAIRAFNFDLDTIRYGNRVPVLVTPVITANFVNGVWNGNVEVLQPAANMFLAAYNGITDPVGVSNPFDADYDPPVYGPVTRIPGGISLTWTTCPGGRYQVQYTTSLFPPPVAWTNLGSPITAAGASLSINDLFSGPWRFYRVIMLP